MNNFLLGSDPEFIISRKGKVVPYLVEEPIQLGGFVTIIKDNVLLELNVPPAASRAEFIEINDEALELTKDFIKKEFDSELTTLNHYEFKNVKDPRFFEFGCLPSFNLYTKKHVIHNPDNNVRYCGGHVHIGIEHEEEAFYRAIIRNMDYRVGLNLEEQQSDRRLYYGKAGEYRLNVGVKVEYRTPSNDWCFGKAGWMWDQTQLAVNDTLDNIVHDFDAQLINQKKVLC